MIDKKRITLSALMLSAVGLIGVVTSEGYSDKAIIPIKGDVPTIGFGTTRGVKLGDTITPAKAIGRALADINEFEGALKRCVTVPLHQYEYDAAVSFSYNVGASAFCSSTLVKKWNAGDYAGGCHELSRWVYAGGRRVQGLVNRREKEKAQCLGELNG
jgi:lysozyme